MLKTLKSALLISYFLFLIFPQSVSSQTNAILAWDGYGMEEHYDTMKSYISVYGNAMFGSTCITTHFANNFISNTFIDSTMSQQVASRFSSNNIMGFDLDEGITYVHQKDTVFHIPVSGYFIALRDRSHTDASFPGDLFNIIFQGNAMYAGQIAHLNNLSLNALHYQQLEFGLAKVYPIYKASYSIGFALSVLKGQSDLTITTGGNTTLGTPATGDSLDIALNANIRQTDTTNSGGYSAFNGWGLSTDFYIKFFDSTSEMSVRLDVKDLGFIRWNSHSITNNLDTTFTFSGFNISNLLTPSDSLNSLSLDSNYTKAYHAHQIRQAYTTPLPAIINLSFRMFLDEENKIPFDAAISYRLFANANPYEYIGVSYFITHKTIIGGSVSYGGYRKLGFGINIGQDLGKGYLIALQTQNIESIALPDKVTGEAALLTFKKFF